MEEGHEDRRDQRDLLRGAHPPGWYHHEVGDGWRHPDSTCRFERDSMRESGQMEGGKTPPYPFSGPMLPHLRQCVEGRFGALREDQTMGAGGGRALDEDSGRYRESRRRRARSSQSEGRVDRTRRQGGRRREAQGARKLRDESEVEKKKEKEEEGEEGAFRKEEEGEGYKAFGGPVRGYGVGSRPSWKKAHHEEGQENCQEEKSEEQFVQSNLEHFQGGQQRGGLGVGHLRTRGQGVDDLDEGSRGAQPWSSRAYAEGASSSIRSTLGPGPFKPSSGVYPILEDGIGWKGHSAAIQRAANSGLCGGPPPAGESCLSRGCGNTEDEESRADCKWWGLQSGTTSGALSPGDSDNVIHDRDAGGFSTTTGRTEGEVGSWKPELGKKRRKGRLRLLGSKRKREEGRLSQGQREKQKRGKERRSKRGRQGEEVTGSLSADEAEISGKGKVSQIGPGQELLRRHLESHVPPLLSEDDENSKVLPVSISAGTGTELAGGFTSKLVTSTSRLLAEDRRLPGGEDFSKKEEMASSVREDPPEAEESLGRPVSLRQLMQQGMKGLKLIDLMGVLINVFDESLKDSNIKHSKIQRSGGVFPLPESHEGLQSCLQTMSVPSSACVLAMCRALNSYYGIEPNDQLTATLAKKAAVRSLSRYADDISGWKEKFDGLDWGDLLATRSIDYKGDEVRVSKQFCWDNLVGAIPDEVGKIPLEEVCDLGTLDYISHFEEYLLPSEAQVYTKPPRVMVEDQHWEQVCSGLVEKGICGVLPVSDLYHVGGQPLLNGMFGVSKDEFANGWEVMRLIMNLVPVNKLCRNLGGDISTLPNWGGMNPFLLQDGEVILMSSEDIRCFFYLFKIPRSWQRFMGFNKLVPGALVPKAWKGRACVLVSRVLPMGFLNSVSIAQHIHRRVARMALQNPLGLGPQNEIRRDKALPNSQTLYRIYLDNFDILEKVDKNTAALLRGEVSANTLNLRQQYAYLGLPRHPKKAVERELVAEIQGAIVDGVSGKVCPKPQKVLKYMSLGLQLLADNRASQKQLQIVCGGFVYFTMFRRQLLGMLNSTWKHIVGFEGEPPIIKKPLPPLVRLEMIRFMCAVPLAQMNLRTPFLGGVTASDASEFGGGFCVSRGLSPIGVHASQCHIRGDLPDESDHVQVLTVGLFDGIGALRVAADALVLPMAGHISSEVSKEGNRVLEAHFPDSELVGPVEAIDEDMVISWACKYSNVGVVLVGGGPPCQGVSGLNSDRKGALKDARSSLFPHVRRVHGLAKKHFRWAQVHYFMESVFSMDEVDRATMSKDIGVIPWMVDSLGVTLCRRPRLYWLSWELQGSEGVILHWATSDSWTDYGIVELKVDIDQQVFLSKGCGLNSLEGLPTFTTARPRASPGNRPAGLWQCSEAEVQAWKEDSHRYPPYQYRWKNLISSPKGDRLPTIAEKEVMMGFPLHYTAACLPKGQQQGQKFLDTRHSLIGNTWNVQVVTWLLSCLFAPLGLTQVNTLDKVVSQLTPGRVQSLRGFLSRLPLDEPQGPSDDSQQAILARKLSSFVSIKGEDLLLQAPSENQVRFQRLRASVPAKLWRWRVVAGWRWRHKQAHINELELRAVVTTLTWRIERLRQQGCRFIHLVDSLVVLHALTRGRSSSRKLRRPLSQINSLLLAADVHPLWAYVSTKQNPADRPSRLKIKKHAVKKG